MTYIVKVPLPNGEDLIAATSPLFYLDYISAIGSGSRTYSLPAGTSLHASSVGSLDGRYTSSYTISGSTINYTVNEYDPIFVWAR